MEQRVIKFRAWDKREGLSKMYYLTGFIQYGEGWTGGNPAYKFYEFHYGNGGFNKVNADEFVLMQFTGLLDKEGKEIYEGDIMSLGTKFQYVVRFEEAKFVVYHTLEQYGKWGDLKRAFDPDFREYNFRVVGNIFENKNLLPC